MEYKIKAVLYSMGGVEYKISYCMAIYKGTFWSKIAISIYVQIYTHEKFFFNNIHLNVFNKTQFVPAKRIYSTSVK